MKFAKWVYLIAGVYGLLVIIPPFFLEGQIGRDTPPPITHPEYYYGFLGVTTAWQVLFLVIARDPLRYRPLMLVTLLEKASAIAFIVLFLTGRAGGMIFSGGLIDLLLLVLFLTAYLKTASPAAELARKQDAMDASANVVS